MPILQAAKARLPIRGPVLLLAASPVSFVSHEQMFAYPSDSYRRWIVVKPVKLLGGSVLSLVGEASFLEEFEAICGPRCHDGHDLAVQATLAAEPDNPHDSNAVAVYVNSRKVAYIPRDKAASYQRLLLDLHRQGSYGWCDGHISAGWDRGHGDTGHFCITLDLAPAMSCLPT